MFRGNFTCTRLTPISWHVDKLHSSYRSFFPYCSHQQTTTKTLSPAKYPNSPDYAKELTEKTHLAFIIPYPHSSTRGHADPFMVFVGKNHIPEIKLFILLDDPILFNQKFHILYSPSTDRYQMLILDRILPSHRPTTRENKRKG